MKRLTCLLLGLFAHVTCLAAPPRTEEAFFAAVRAAYEAKDIAKIHALTWEKGISDWDRKMTERTLPMVLKSFDTVEKLTDVPIPADFPETRIGFGKRTEPTHPITGVVEVSVKSHGQNTASQKMIVPYAIIDGGYYMVTGKTTDLHWNGPKDRQLGVTINGKGWDQVAIHIKYNASGVPVERTQKAMSTIFVGQYLEEVTVVSDRDDVDVILLLREGGEQIYESQPLKGKGQIHYKRSTSGTVSK